MGSMSPQPYRVLAICPYRGLDNIIKKTAGSFPELSVFYEFGELSHGVEIALQYVTGEIDAIISRGGTAKLISQKVKIPTFDIGITTSDLINTLTLVRNSGSKKICLVGFTEVTMAARGLDKLLGRTIPTYVITTTSENSSLMKKLKNENVELVIGDATAVRYASIEGINNIMISSGEDSVFHCLDTVVTLFRMQKDSQGLASLQRNIIKNLGISFFIINLDSTLLHTQIASSDLIKISSDAMQQISSDYANKFSKGLLSQKTLFEHEGHSWLIECKKDIFRSQVVILVTWQKFNHVSAETDVLLHNIAANTYPFQVESFNSSDEKMRQAIADCKAFSQQKEPILIVGELFTGRQAMAHMLYNLSSFAKEGIFLLDAKDFSESRLKELFETSSSYMTSLSITLVVRNLQHIDKSLAELFLLYIGKTGFCQRSRLICLFDEIQNPALEEQIMLTRYLLSNLKALLISVPPLRERRGDLIFLATIAIGEACSINGKACSGFTKRAQEFILNHPWYGNLHELRGIIRQVVTSLSSEYIEDVDLQRAEQKWQTLYLPKENCKTESSFLTGTLDEIETKIINMVLHEEGGNKTRVTKRLGISRNTLWRKLKDQDKALHDPI